MSWFDPASAPETGAGLLAAQVIVIATEPVPGRVATRPTRALSPADAGLAGDGRGEDGRSEDGLVEAALAEAALADTLDVVGACAVARRVIALDGAPGAWLPPGFDLIGQRAGRLDERIAAAFADAYATASLPMVLIGMDTPQITPDLVQDAAQSLMSGEADAVFGSADDGGFWLLGLRRPDRSLLAGVPMSRPDTGYRQLERLTDAGLRVALAPRLTEVGTFDTAARVARQIPDSRFAAVFRWAMEGRTVRS